MLPAEKRLARRAEFSQVVRRGRRSRRGSLLIYLAAETTAVPARFGFIVGKGVGNAVVRHRTTRRLRHLAAMQDLSGFLVVVRALPEAGKASFTRLDRDFSRVLHQLTVGSSR